LDSKTNPKGGLPLELALTPVQVGNCRLRTSAGWLHSESLWSPIRTMGDWLHRRIEAACAAPNIPAGSSTLEALLSPVLYRCAQPHRTVVNIR
jgi:hypothetical protein